MYSLIYIERPNNTNTSAALCGPLLFEDNDQAIKKVYKYVEGRIPSCCSEFFVESYSGLSEESEEILELNSDDICVRVEQYLESISNVLEMENIVDWYFDYANDDNTEAYYTVNNLTVLPNKNSNPFSSEFYDDNSIENIKLLASISKIAMLATGQIEAVGKLMDLDVDEVKHLLIRAENEFERIEKHQKHAI
jgi:hypothetical protein